MKQRSASRKRTTRRRNPIAIYNPVRLVPLPMRDVTILYTRTAGKYAGQGFRHDYHDVRIYGSRDGSIILKHRNGKKLWGTA